MREALALRGSGKGRGIAIKALTEAFPTRSTDPMSVFVETEASPARTSRPREPRTSSKRLREEDIEAMTVKELDEQLSARACVVKSDAVKAVKKARLLEALGAEASAEEDDEEVDDEEDADEEGNLRDFIVSDDAPLEADANPAPKQQEQAESPPEHTDAAAAPVVSDELLDLLQAFQAEPNILLQALQQLTSIRREGQLSQEAAANAAAVNTTATNPAAAPPVAPAAAPASTAAHAATFIPPAAPATAAAAPAPAPAPASATAQPTAADDSAFEGVTAHWRQALHEVNPNTGKEYYFTGLEIIEADNQQWLQILRAIKIYGKREPGPNALAGLRSGGAFTTVGWKRMYTLRISDMDLRILHTTLQGFRSAWATRTAAVNNSTPVPLRITGIGDALTRPRVDVMTSPEGQVAIGGATFLLKKSGVTIDTLGTNDGARTFSWESDAKVYVCDKPWSAAQVRQLVAEAVAARMPAHNVDVQIRN